MTTLLFSSACSVDRDLRPSTRAVSRTLLLLALVLGGRAGVQAQTPVDVLPDLPAVIKAGDRVSVTDLGGQETTGRLVTVSASGFSLLVRGEGGEPRHIALTDVRQIDKRGDPLWEGFLIGAGIGTAQALRAPVGAYAVSYGGGFVIAGLAFHALLGGGIGALIDAAIDGRTVVFSLKDAALRFEPVFLPDRRGGGLSFVVTIR